MGSVLSGALLITRPGAPEGVGAYAYQDSAGNRYGGTYGLNDGQFFGQKGQHFPIPFAQNNFQNNFLDLDDFFPEYFRNFENLLQEAFHSNLENQRIALNAASKAFDLTSNQAGYIPSFPHRSPFNNFPGFGVIPSFPTFGMSNFPNSAFAGGAAGPGFTHQIASINPSNPDMPNVDVMNRFADVSQTPGGNYVAMSSRAYSVSSNVNGKEYKDRGAETTVNNNGKITTYRVKS
uniref:Seroin transcript 2C n=1 Tax=Galleria mellonella TaxID=7137 RepID=A0A3G1T149_GALME|nr:seroin transcript 2C [Galleria mellonella]